MHPIKVTSVCLQTGNRVVVDPVAYVRIHDDCLRNIHFNTTIDPTDQTVFDKLPIGSDKSYSDPFFRFIYIAETNEGFWCFDKKLNLINPSSLLGE